jgi:predicted ATP-dependent endonuclease of OLD family
MKLRSIAIRNFRGLSNLETEFGELASVIVGPNAMGKTTFLEAIRLTRCLLAPRYINEQGEMLTQIGALSPHTGLLQYSSLVSDDSKQLEVQLDISLNDNEVTAAEQNIPRLALLHVRDTLGVQPDVWTHS